MISDSVLLLIVAFALGFIASRCMNNQNVLTGDVEEGSDRGNPWVTLAAFSIIGVVAYYVWNTTCGSVLGKAKARGARLAKGQDYQPEFIFPFGGCNWWLN